MATTSKPKTRTTKKPAKRSITKKEYDAITNSYYRLKGMVYKMVESGKYTDEAEKQLRKFIRGLEKARKDVNWYRASNYAAG